MIIDDECTDLKKFINNELIHVKNDCTSFDENNNGLLERHVFDAINRLNCKKYIKSIK